MSFLMTLVMMFDDSPEPPLAVQPVVPPRVNPSSIQACDEPGGPCTRYHPARSLAVVTIRAETRPIIRLVECRCERRDDHRRGWPPRRP